MALNPWQIARQIADRVALATWPDSPSDKILTGGAVVSADRENNFRPNVGYDDAVFSWLSDGPPTLTPPFGRVVWLGGNYDLDVPGRFVEARCRVWIVCGKGGVHEDPNDNAAAQTHGTDSLVGKALGPNGQGGSVGRGLDEVVNAIVERALNAGSQLDDPSFALQGYVERMDNVKAVSGVKLVARPFDVVVTNAVTARQYHGVRQLAGSVVAGTGTLTWTNPPLRFDSTPDFPRVLVKAGAVPPSGPNDGTATVLPVTGRVTTISETPGVSGQRSYAVFGAYDESMPGPPVTANANRWSVAATKTLTYP